MLTEGERCDGESDDEDAENSGEETSDMSRKSSHIL